MGGNGARYGKDKKKTIEERLRDALRKGDNDSYLFDVEYEKLKKENERLQAEYEKAREEYLKLSEELRREMENGTASESDQARFMAMLSERGVQLQQQQKEMESTLNDIAEQRQNVDNQMAQLRSNAFAGSTHANDYKQADSSQKYKGFKNDNWGEAKVVEMSPTEYLRRMAYQFGNGNLEGLLRTVSPREIENMARQMERGTRYNSPSLDFRSSKANGTKSVLASLLNGYKRIPVLLIE